MLIVIVTFPFFLNYVNFQKNVSGVRNLDPCVLNNHGRAAVAWEMAAIPALMLPRAPRGHPSSPSRAPPTQTATAPGGVLVNGESRPHSLLELDLSCVVTL